MYIEDLRDAIAEKIDVLDYARRTVRRGSDHRLAMDERKDELEGLLEVIDLIIHDADDEDVRARVAAWQDEF